MKDPRPELIRMLTEQGYTLRNPDALPRTARSPRDDLRAWWCSLATASDGREVTLFFWSTPTRYVRQGFTVQDSCTGFGADKDVYPKTPVPRGPRGPKRVVRTPQSANSAETLEGSSQSMSDTNPSIDLRTLVTLVIEDLDAHLGAVSVPLPTASWVGHSFLNVQPHELDMRRRLLTEDVLRAQRKASVLLACVAALNALRDGRPDLAARSMALLDGLSVEQWTARELARPR